MTGLKDDINDKAAGVAGKVEGSTVDSKDVDGIADKAFTLVVTDASGKPMAVVGILQSGPTVVRVQLVLGGDPLPTAGEAESTLTKSMKLAAANT